MKRPAGLVIAAVLLILGSLLTFLMSGFMVLGAIVAPRVPATALQAAPQPSWLPVMMFVLAGLAVLIAAWGIATAVGVLRFRAWARYSILIIGGCVAVFSLISALSCGLFLFMPIPLPPSADPSQMQGGQMTMRIIFASIAVSYLIAAAMGIWWLFYFNSKAIRGIFAQPHVEMESNPRPILISILSVLNMIGAVICLAYALLPVPAMILGFALHGWGKFAIYLLFAAASGAVGWGLWRLQEWGRRLALGVLGFGVINTVVYIVRPSLMAGYTAEINRSMGIAAGPLSPAYQNTMLAFSMGISTLFLIGIAAVLILYRSAFQNSEMMAG